MSHHFCLIVALFILSWKAFVVSSTTTENWKAAVDIEQIQDESNDSTTKTYFQNLITHLHTLRNETELVMRLIKENWDTNKVQPAAKHFEHQLDDVNGTPNNNSVTTMPTNIELDENSLSDEVDDTTMTLLTYPSSPLNGSSWEEELFGWMIPKSDLNSRVVSETTISISTCKSNIPEFYEQELCDNGTKAVDILGTTNSDLIQSPSEEEKFKQDLLNWTLPFKKGFPEDENLPKKRSTEITFPYYPTNPSARKEHKQIFHLPMFKKYINNLLSLFGGYTTENSCMKQTNLWGTKFYHKKGRIEALQDNFSHGMDSMPLMKQEIDDEMGFFPLTSPIDEETPTTNVNNSDWPLPGPDNDLASLQASSIAPEIATPTIKWKTLEDVLLEKNEFDMVSMRNS